jgi:hypothetical protein
MAPCDVPPDYLQHALEATRAVCPPWLGLHAAEGLRLYFYALHTVDAFPADRRAALRAEAQAAFVFDVRCGEGALGPEVSCLVERWLPELTAARLDAPGRWFAEAGFMQAALR